MHKWKKMNRQRNKGETKVWAFWNLDKKCRLLLCFLLALAALLQLLLLPNHWSLIFLIFHWSWYFWFLLIMIIEVSFNHHTSDEQESLKWGQDDRWIYDVATQGGEKGGPQMRSPLQMMWWWWRWWGWCSPLQPAHPLLLPPLSNAIASPIADVALYHAHVVAVLVAVAVDRDVLRRREALLQHRACGVQSVQYDRPDGCKWSSSSFSKSIVSSSNKNVSPALFEKSSALSS